MDNKTKETSFGDRSKRQNGEGYEEVKTDLPKGRFSETKQIVSTDELGGAGVPITGVEGKIAPSTTMGTVAAKKIKAKVSVSPDATVEVLDGKQVGGVPLQTTENQNLTRGAAGLGQIPSVSSARDMSKTNYTGGNYRPSSRYGKKRADDLFEIDNTISEQVVPTVDDAKDLRESPDSLQGYNGRKQFKQTRSKKNFAGVPQVLLHEDSADFVFDDATIAVNGQMIDSIPAQSDYPTELGTPATLVDGVLTPVAIPNPMKKGNYMPESLVVTTANGIISGVSIHESRYIVDADVTSQDQANMNWQLDSNNNAKSMIRMQTELGRETTDKWSPLGYVINQPYQYNQLSHDIEGVTGAISAIAYRSAVSSLAFQRNILAKDGVGPQANAIKMFVEDYLGQLETNSDLGAGDFNHWLFNANEYRKGSAAGLIRMFDSTVKYRTKGDILGMQRSLAMHLSQADNNIDSLHVNPLFMRALDKAHLFSTPTGEYNPLLPIYATRKIRLILPFSLNYFLQGWVNPASLTNAQKTQFRDQDTGSLTSYVYSYKDIRNTYTTRVQMPLIEGLLRWLLKHQGAWVSTFGDNNTTTIPFAFDFTNPGLLEFMLCSASQEILWERNICFRDILFAGEQSTYIWDDLVSLKELDPLHSSQMKIADYNTPLQLGKMAPDTAIRTFWGDSMLRIYTNGNERNEYVLPWYMNEQAINPTSGAPWTANSGPWSASTPYNMSIPSIRDGVRHAYVDVIKSLDERDIRLALDRMVSIPKPVLSGPLATSPSVDHVFYSDYSVTNLNNAVKIASLRYDQNSDGRLVVKYDSNVGSNDHHLCEGSLLCVPKEIGYIWPGMKRFRAVINTMTATEATGITATYYDEPDDVTDTYTGGRTTSIVSYRVKADALTSGSIDRSAALTQVFYTCFADQELSDANVLYTNRIGLAPSESQNGGDPENLLCMYSIGTSTHVSDTVFPADSFATMARKVSTKLQRFMMPINPFENAYVTATTGVIADFDPLESSFYFGLSGMLASDYSQDILERLDVRDQLGVDYTKDKFQTDSLIFRES